MGTAEQKDFVRRQELLKRDEQLSIPSVDRFVRAMETRRHHNGTPVSIFDLMRDGSELASSLHAVRSTHRKNRIDGLRSVVDPYLEFVTADARCTHTGMRLQDIWRYFRHTWVTQYGSTPGRSLLFLVRDRAAKCHPVIGIGALSSPIVQLRERDRWIGWDPDVFIENAKRSPSVRVARWLTEVIENGVAELHLDDLVADGIVTRNNLRRPNARVVSDLRREGRRCRDAHHRFSSASEHKQRCDDDGDPDEYWRSRACTHLFRSKRALALAELLEARCVVDSTMAAGPTRSGLRSLLSTREGQRVVSKLVRRAKARRVGIAMADISVCGAVQPYNAILGGKLVSMLAASPEIIAAYKRRYSKAESEIASAMAGRRIVRAPHLVLLGTTSLYSVGSSQYNRVRIPADRLGGRSGDEVRYLKLGYSEAFGTSQFSARTVGALTALAEQSANGQRVNSIFGEGANPKMRKVRHGLDLIGVPDDLLLRHGRKRVIYGVSLARNLRQYLLGFDRKPRYLVSPRSPAAQSSAIALWWTERWLSGRIDSDEVLWEVAAHTTTYPVKHGARVAAQRGRHDESRVLDT